MEKRINGEIRGYIIQIVVTTIFVVVSYFMFTNSRIGKYASVAAAYDTMDLDLMVSYKQSVEAILTSENTLDKGVLSVKNPNKKNMNSTVYLYISDNANLNIVDIIIDGNTVNTKIAYKQDGCYVIPILNCEINAYDSKYINTEIKGDAFYITPFSYRFNVVSF